VKNSTVRPSPLAPASSLQRRRPVGPQPRAGCWHEGRARRPAGRQPHTWGDNASTMSSCRSYSRAKGAGLVRARFLWHFPYLERVQRVIDAVRRGPVGPPGPLELAALPHTRRRLDARSRSAGRQPRTRRHADRPQPRHRCPPGPKKAVQAPLLSSAQPPASQRGQQRGAGRASFSFLGGFLTVGPVLSFYTLAPPGRPAPNSLAPAGGASSSWRPPPPASGSHSRRGGGGPWSAPGRA
jgi:hypothetical protein